MSRRVGQDWMPDEGDVVAGTIIDAMVVPTIKLGDVPLAVIKERDTDIKFGCWLTPKMLRRLFDEKRPAPGSKVVIQFNGKRDGNKGREYKHFTVRVERSLEHDGTTWIEGFRAAIDKEESDES
jgi:hypothetical protein